ncbi:MAG: ABC transporter ATP-binding protein [Candidatus Binatia bacterium]|nr:MAG: ABC transporter ATP-binding protein [Candidatus Binatia bacterium]
MIVAQGLTKRFGPFAAIEDVTFEVERGEIVGLLGPNGAGKTTTMRILAGVFPPTSGRALVAGYDVVEDALRARRVVGYFPERVSLYLDMTVREYLEYAARLQEVPTRERPSAIAHAMHVCGVEHVSRRLLGTLSKGYRQRVGIAQALLAAPRVLILDEPTSGLDPEQVAEVRSLIRSLRGERTVVLSTHILSEVEATCDRVLIINRGRLLAVDTPSELARKVRDRSEIHLEVGGPASSVAERIARLPGVLQVERTASSDGAVTLRVSTTKEKDLRPEIARLVVEQGWQLREIRHVSLSLEEIFLALVGRQSAGASAA